MFLKFGFSASSKNLVSVPVPLCKNSPLTVLVPICCERQVKAVSSAVVALGETLESGDRRIDGAWVCAMKIVIGLQATIGFVRRTVDD